MAKKAAKSKVRKAKQPLRQFDVYLQDDGNLVVLSSGDQPEIDLEPVWSGEAVDERDAVAEARHSDKKLRKAGTAVPEHDPNQPTRLREEVERATNERLGITTTRSKTRSGRTKRTKTGARKKTAKTARKVARKSTRPRSRR